MELPRRPKDDLFTKPGAYRELESRVRRRMEGTNDPVLFVSAFDRRTRIGPFLFIDKRLIPGAPRAIGAALQGAGFERTRIALQQWSPRLRPSLARIDGQVPQMLLISSMQIHSQEAYRLISDAWLLGPDRPLIIAGGAKAIYEPWDFFGLGPDGRQGADVVVTGEEYVLMELLDRILEFKGQSETWLRAFQRTRDAGALDAIPGLVFPRDPDFQAAGALINTGTQRLVRDLEDLPSHLNSLHLFEPPHKCETLADRALHPHELSRHVGVLALTTTHGCRFNCPYCPIHAYNQGCFRHRSAEGLIDEITGTIERTGIVNFFGTDDNFFNHRAPAQEILEGLGRGRVGGKPFRDAIWLGTEATEQDMEKSLDLVPAARDAGIRAIWFGIEDMTSALVKKGQSPEKTKRVFRALLDQGIAPMPMMMHFDGQPLWSRKGLSGLLNQVRYLKRSGAVSLQITFLTPSVGSRSYGQTYRDGMVLQRVGNKPVSDYHYDGNHCIATQSRRPWSKQLNMMLGYISFYNPLRALRSLTIVDEVWKVRMIYQFLGHLGVAWSAWRHLGWYKRLVTGPIERHHSEPEPKFPIIEARSRPRTLPFPGGVG